MLRLMQTAQSLTSLNITEAPLVKRRLLNHWDNLTGIPERGYAGNTLWIWSSLPATIGQRYKDYARACASIGINGAVLNNVNADKTFLTAAYLPKIKALADVFRPYGIKVYLSANFAAPNTIGGQSTADPLNANVIAWWKRKADTIYAAIPDFGGYLVKANSEGQPGPKTYGRTHADGANCLADAMAPYGGIVIWRAFVYDDAIDADRMKRAYKEFKPLDGQFHSNVVIQAKNGPFDFQPREPIHPLFGGLLTTHIGSEFQITKEYLGQAKQLVYLGPYWKEVLDFDTYAKGAGSTVSKVLDGSLYGDTLTLMSGVANTGTDSNWCGHQFNQANWYAFGRLAWNHDLSSDTIADEWTKMTWGWNSTVVTMIKKMLKGSREACVNYMDPLGLGGIFSSNAHYGPEPSYNGSTAHADWNSVYWHRADTIGVGYNRTSSGGSDFVDQYFAHNKSIYDTISTCPLEYLCWFHHVPWSRPLSTGRTFWNELCFRYYDGVQYVTNMKSQWASLSGQIDAARFSQVTLKLDTNEKDAKIWRDTCVKYFQKFSKLTIPPYTSANAYSVKRLPPASGGSGIVRIYSVQGKLVKTINTKFGSAALRGVSIARGVYIVKRDGYVPYRIMTGSDNRLLLNQINQVQ